MPQLSSCPGSRARHPCCRPLAAGTHRNLQLKILRFGKCSSLFCDWSLALHVIDPATGERVAQGDVGVGPGAFALVRSDIDVSDMHVLHRFHID